jgi:hypothetical protein
LGLYFAERVFIDDLPVDRIVHELLEATSLCQ